MSLTPLKAAKSLLLSARVSPNSSKVLSPFKDKIANAESKIKTLQFPEKQENSTNFCKNVLNNNTNIIAPNLIRINITDFDHSNCEEILLINSPNKRILLKYGINKYHLLHSLLGKGSFGTVIKGMYKGEQLIEKLVAVKVIKVEDSSMNINENNARHLSHENIIKIIDIIVNSNAKYGLILMEYHRNSRNLQDILDDVNFNLDRKTVIKFSKDIANGLCYCHKNDILHLDIKPKNVLLCKTTCKICDFGNSVKESDATHSFKYKGTVAYTAPEILKGNGPTSRSDIFSLGILFWQLISRRLPYESMDNEVIIYKVVKFNFRPVIDAEISKNLEDFCELCCFCWEQNPSDRPSAAQVCNILSVFI